MRSRSAVGSPSNTMSTKLSLHLSRSGSTAAKHQISLLSGYAPCCLTNKTYCLQGLIGL